ncbi:hypothetical protein [Actinosynnema sp.]|uniref:hypothetical protein n=1 Tax=Actinosynnema sp. TaxID=1872144 RepID=UPI003F861D1E
MPRTRRSGVLWIGWSTRHESVLARRPEAISVSLHDVEGPGRGALAAASLLKRRR